MKQEEPIFMRPVPLVK